MYFWLNGSIELRVASPTDVSHFLNQSCGLFSKGRSLLFEYYPWALFSQELHLQAWIRPDVRTGNIEDNDIMEFHNDRPHDIIKIPGVITHWMMHDDYNLTKIKHVEMQIKHRFIH